MNKVIKTAVLFAVAIIITKASLAQQGLQLNLNYNIATPLGSAFRDYVNKASFAGVQGSVLHSVTDHLRIGVQSAYSDFHEKHSEPVYSRNTVKTVPLLAKGEYSFSNKAYVKPYVGLGGGVDFVNYDDFQSGSKDHNKYTKAGFTGDAGVLIPLQRSSRYGFRASTSYNLMPFDEQGIKNLDSWNVQAGVSIPLSK
jgi:opacity protein-like surface antigen